jgi:hypothetical protein
VLIVGRTGTGQRLGIFSGSGGEVSNDHYALYDVRFVEGAPRIIQQQHKHRRVGKATVRYD